ncbi:MAG: prenyltransferase [Nitrososphaerota archaeon]
MPGLRVLFLATRPWSFLMTIVATTLGLTLAVRTGFTGLYDLILFLLVLAGLISLHAAANMVNDLYDVKHEVDKPSSPTARYRRHYILIGEIKVTAFMLEILFFYAVAISIAAYFVIIRGWVVLFFALAGAFLTYAYTADPFKLKHLALGEISVFLAWGPLMTTGTYYVLTGILDWLPVYASIPIGLFVALVLFANNMRDIEYDRAAGIKTLAIVLGHRRSLAFYKYTLISIYVFLGLLVVLKVFSAYALIAYLTIPKAAKIVRMFYERIPEAADPITAQLSFNFGSLLILGEALNLLLKSFI